MTPRSFVVPALLCALLLRAAPAAAEGEGARVLVVPLDGAPVEGALESVKDGALRLAGRAAPLPLAQVRTIRFPVPATAGSAPRAASGPRVRLVLRGDETLRGTFSKGTADAIELKPDDLPVLRVPFESIRRVEAESAHKGACDVPTKGRPPRSGTDVAYAASGDAVAGTWIDAGPAGLVLEADRRKTTVAWNDLLVLHVDEPALPPPAGLVAEIDTLGGSRLVAEKVESDGRSWKVTTRAGVSVEVPLGAIAEVRFTGGAFVYACDLPFRAKYTHFYEDDNPAYLEMMWGTRVDVLPRGCPLTVGGVVYRHGFSAHAKSEITIPLGKAYTRFEAKFAIDDFAKQNDMHGDVVARITADGKQVWTSGGHVKGGEPARAVGPIDVTGVSELVLETDFGDGFNVNDWADWLDPLLVRAK